MAPDAAEGRKVTDEQSPVIGIPAAQQPSEAPPVRARTATEALYALLLHIVTVDDAQAIIDAILAAAMEILEADYAAVSTLPTRPGEQAWSIRRGYRGSYPVPALPYPSLQGANGLSSRAMRARSAVVIEAFGRDPAFPPTDFPLHVAEGMQSGIGVPLLRPAEEAGQGSEAFGALALGYRRPCHFVASQVELATGLAHQAAVALERARLLTVERQRSSEQAAIAAAAAKRYEQERLARQALEQAQENSQAFLRLVAHDLKTPLTNILGYSQLGQRLSQRLATAGDSVGDTPTRLRGAFDHVVENCRRLQRLVDDLQEAFRLGSGRFEPKREPVDLVTLARQAVDEHQALAPAHRITVESAGEPITGNWDAERLRQLLNNLLSNAVKYSPNGGDVSVSVQQQGGAAVLRVTDQGIGVPKDDLLALFQPYSRLHQSRPIKGTGLGLYIVKGIAEAHGGSVRAESQGEGQGTTFIVELPVGADG